MCKEKRETAFKLLFLVVFLFALSGLLYCLFILYTCRATPTVSHDKSPTESPIYDEGTYSMEIHLVLQEKFSGELYYETGSDRDGIGFEVVINSTYYTLRVTRLATGMDAINVLHPQSSNMTLTSIKNVTFMIMMNSTSQMNDYIVPHNATGLMETMMRSNDPRMTDSLFAELDSSNVNEVREYYLRLLAASREGCGVIIATVILGNTNLVESSFPPAVRQLYLLGLQLEKMRNDMLSGITKCGGCASGQDFCPAAGANNDCYGVCADHDRCCQDKGFYTWACFRAGYNSFSSNCWDNFSCFSIVIILVVSWILEVCSYFLLPLAIT